MARLGLAAVTSAVATGVVAIHHFRRWRRDQADAKNVAAVFQRSPELPVLSSTPKVSALIPAFNKGEDIEALVRSFCAIEYPNKELVLAIGGAHRLEDYRHLESAGIALVQNRGGSKNAALALCLEKATGEILYLSDADCRYNTDSFIRLIAPIVNGEADAAGGRARPLPGQEKNLLVQFQRSSYVRLRGALPGEPVYGPTMLGRNSAIRRDVLEASGGFAADVLGDDYYLPRRVMQAGYKIRAVVDSTVDTDFPTTIPAYVRQQSRWTRALFLDAPRLGEYGHAFRALRSSFLGILMLGLTVALPFTRRHGFYVLIPLLAYSYLARLRRALFAAKVGTLKLRPVHVPGALLHAYLDFVIWSRALVEYLVPRWRKRW